MAIGRLIRGDQSLSNYYKINKYFCKYHYLLKGKYFFGETFVFWANFFWEANIFFLEGRNFFGEGEKLVLHWLHIDYSNGRTNKHTLAQLYYRYTLYYTV